MESTRDVLIGMGCKVGPSEDGKGYRVTLHDGRIVLFWPYSGWWSGKGIGQGRGFKKLLSTIRAARNKRGTA